MHSTGDAIVDQLYRRHGRLHVMQRLGMEADYEAKVFGPGINFFHLENWYSIHGIIRGSLRAVGMHERGRRNALKIQLRHNDCHLPTLPKGFDGFTILHLTDLHVDMGIDTVSAIATLIKDLHYDICVLTGDYRAKTFGPYTDTLLEMNRLCGSINKDMYGVLGNHDTIRMVPGLEKSGIRMLLNENLVLRRNGDELVLVGIDDAHYYQMDNIEKACSGIDIDGFTLLLSHTPEVFRHAAHANFNLMLSGHTHGGQICLPGGYPITLDAKLPRRMGRGPWHYHGLLGYTSVGAGASIVGVRLNCLPEITLHHLHGQ